MNIQTIIIGEYQMSPSVAFGLYQVPSPLVTPPRSLEKQQQQLPTAEYFNYFCLEDLFAIFDLHATKQDLIQSYQYYPGLFCKDETTNRSFIQTHVMADIALKYKLYNLVDLCRLDGKDLLLGGAVPLLKMTTCLRLHQKAIKTNVMFKPRPLNGIEWFFREDNIKLEPFSPTLSPPRCERLSFESNSLSFSRMSKTSITTTAPTPTTPVVVTTPADDSFIKLPKPSSLLLKRLAPKHGHKKNLTILTPSYNEDSTTGGIQSAPLRRTTIPPFHQRSTGSNNKILKKTSPTSNLSKTATASTFLKPWPQTSIQPRFPSPPIVPSQQPSWGQYHRPRKATTATPPPPPPPQTSVLTQKQKFLQPFEYLYDHIEQTRVLKTSLDDQIRRSSSLMQTLQSSGTMVESIVRRQIRDMLDEKFETKLRECTERIARLEYRASPAKDIPISPAVSPTSCKDQPKDLLAQLMNRIDQLESKLLEK